MWWSNFKKKIKRNPAAFVLLLFSLFWPVVILVGMIMRNMGKL